MDPQAGLNAFSEGAKAVTKFQEIMQKVFGPRWTRKQADADAYADERKLQTIRDNPDMEIIYVNGQLNARERTPEALAYRAEQRKLVESSWQENNLENVMQKAIPEISAFSNDEVSDDKVDDDWIARFFQIVKDISSEEMQYVWAKILANEIKQPGSFSFRTLDIVRNISQVEAQSFQKIIPILLTVKEVIFPQDSDLLSKYGIDFDTVETLAECGLASTEGFCYTHYNISNNLTLLMRSGSKGIAAKATTDKPIEYNFYNYRLTRAGRELYRALNLGIDANDDYLFNLAQKIASDVPSLSVGVYNLVHLEDGQIFLKKQPIKSFESN